MDKLYARIYESLDRRDYISAKQYIASLQSYDAPAAAQLMTCLYIEQALWQEALGVWQKLYELLPDDFYTAFLHARILVGRGRYVSAYGELKKIVIPQKYMTGYGEKIANLEGQCCRVLGKHEEAAAAYRKASKLAEERSLQVMEYSNYLFNLHYCPNHSADFLYQQAKGFSKLVEGVTPYTHGNVSKRRQRIRIGYLSPDFRYHVVLCFCYGLLTAYNREEFELYVYMLGPEDAYSHNLKRQVTVWRNLRGKPAAEAAQTIYMDGIDILVDLAGHTKGNGLPIMAYKPASIQISGIGYFASTGMNRVDYFIGDVYLDSENTQQEFVENLLVLPHSHFCYRPLHTVPLPEKAAWQRNGYVTFGSFNNFAKVNDEVLAVWAKILDMVSESHLLLKAAVFDGGEVETYTKERLQKAGLPMERVECRGVSDDYLLEYGDMDIALDTFPYPGGGTSCDALYMGRPLITLAGKSHGGRFGYSLLMNMGVGELAAFSVEDYIERAVALARDRELLTILQVNIRSMMQKSPLMDTKQYVHDVENVYKMLMKKQLGG